METHPIPISVKIEARKLGKKRDDFCINKGYRHKWGDSHFTSKNANLVGALGECMFNHLFPDYSWNDFTTSPTKTPDFTIDEGGYDLKTQIMYKEPGLYEVYKDYWFNCEDIRRDLKTDKRGYIGCGVDNVPIRAKRFYLFGMIDMDEVTKHPLFINKSNSRLNAHRVPFKEFQAVPKPDPLRRFLR